MSKERRREGGELIEGVVGEVYRFPDGLWAIRKSHWIETDIRKQPEWYKLGRKEKRRLNKQRRLARLGRPVTLRDLAANEGLMLFCGKSGMTPDVILYESISDQHCECNVRWVGWTGWQAIHKAHWDEEMPNQSVPTPRGSKDSRSKFSVKALLEKWGMWTVTRAYTADAGPSTKLLRVTTRGKVEVIGQWARVRWSVLKQIFLACEILQDLYTTDENVAEAIADVLPPPLVQIEAPKRAKPKRTYAR